MRILVHDFSGHPFQVQLSRELAKRNHNVMHLYSAVFQTGKGNLRRGENDADGFRAEPVDVGLSFNKYSAWKRPLQEFRYGWLTGKLITAEAPNIVISSNTPLFAQVLVQRAARRAGAGFIFWQQDVYSMAMSHTAEQRYGRLGAVLGRLFVALERHLLRASDAVVAISADFRPILERWRISSERVRVIENWAPLDEIRPLPRDNSWSREHGLADGRTVLYAGTLALKHNPALLSELAERVAPLTDVRVVVVSEGPGADWLKRKREERELTNLLVLPRQPYDSLSEVLATGDILVAILDPDAGQYSVPSKVLSYHCAARPLLAAIPKRNLAARIIAGNGSGLVTDPLDVAGFIASAESLLSSPELREQAGRAARHYADNNFEISAIADQFEQVIKQVLEREGATHGQA